MEINKREMMSKLDSVSDSQLQELVKTIAKCAGVSDRRADKAVADISKLRRGLSTMSEKELNDALSMLDEETVENLKRQLNM